MTDNNEIRNKVLRYLHKKFYEDGFGKPMDIKQVVQEAGILEEDYGLANANINYLEESSLIKGIQTIGRNIS
ncbi:MAG TPA: hypothetical protein VNB95_05515 [Nitrososphaera sp.]|nr:hypothetical protein [Nitrososphaera sp.]